MRLRFTIPANDTLYDLHAAGYDESPDDFYEAIGRALVRNATEVEWRLVPHEEAPELEDLIDLVDGMFDALTTRPDWRSDEVEWVADKVMAARSLLYEGVELTITVPEEDPPQIIAIIDSGITDGVAVLADVSDDG